VARLRPFIYCLLALIAPALFLASLTAAKGVYLLAQGGGAFWSGERAGEAKILGPVEIGINLLRQYHVPNYRLVYPKSDFWIQRTIEGAWPSRISTQSKYVLTMLPIDIPLCHLMDQRPIDQAHKVMLYVCG
jgi:hypothetical protein